MTTLLPGLHEHRRPEPESCRLRLDVPIVCGVAHNFSHLTRPRWPARSRDEREAVIIQPCAFDASIRLAAKRIGAIRLLLEHDSDCEIASTADSSLSVWADEHSLYFSVLPFTARGAAAARLLESMPALRQCSVGGNSLNYESLPGPVCRMRQVDLDEISIVTAGANPGTSVELIY